MCKYVQKCMIFYNNDKIILFLLIIIIFFGIKKTQGKRKLGKGVQESEYPFSEML